MTPDQQRPAVHTCQRCGRTLDPGADKSDIPVHLVPPGAEHVRSGRLHSWAYTLCVPCYRETNPDAEHPAPWRDLSREPDTRVGQRALAQSQKAEEKASEKPEGDGPAV